MGKARNKAVFIIPYFGKAPAMYESWKYTAIRNNEFDFLFISDLREIVEEENIHVIRMSFTELREYIQSKFDFPISLREPYKLCDYRPAYGYIFSEYIDRYNFWGNCDIDVLLGKLTDFLTDEVFETYDKILELGHLTLYRNIDKCNKLFMSDGPYPEFNYREVFSSPESFWFDEFYGMMLKSRREQITTFYAPNAFADINPKRLSFAHAKKKDEEIYLEWAERKMFQISVRTHEKKPIMYVHFQRRNMDYIKGMFPGEGSPIYIFSNRISRNAEYRKNGVGKELVYWLKEKSRAIRAFGKRYKMVDNRYSSILDYYFSRLKLKRRRKVVNRMLRQ